MKNVLFQVANKRNDGGLNMIEEAMSKDTSRKKIGITFIVVGIVTMFIAGYTAGAIVYSQEPSSECEISSLQQDSLSYDADDEDVSDSIYVYNTTSLAQLYESVQDSVVVITGVAVSYSFFGMQYSGVQGSGFVFTVNDEPVVVTNKHVVDDASNITVTFSDGNGYAATVIGSDAYSDLAVLSVQAPLSEFQPLTIASSSTLQVGDPVVAIGSPFGLGGTMTTGIISQLGRTIQESTFGSYPLANIIQTSAAINPGNSGGPLLNYEGEVVGITTAIIEDSNGLGFAIPSNTILREIESLVTIGSYDEHAWLGISGVDMTYSIAEAIGVDVTYGWLITQVTRGGAADDAGLQGGSRQMRLLDSWVVVGGDIIVAVDGVRIVNGDALMSYLEENTTPYQIIKVAVVRDDQLLTIQVELGQRPVAS